MWEFIEPTQPFFQHKQATHMIKWTDKCNRTSINQDYQGWSLLTFVDDLNRNFGLLRAHINRGKASSLVA